jgi:SAM-dependent methyltransferase
MAMTDDVSALAEQLAYYRARAHEYDQWWLREGRYDRGVEANERWFTESAEVAAALEAFQPAGHVLELACGTGIWSERLLAHASRLVLVDGSREMLDLAEHRLQSPAVRYIESDIFHWQPTETFDTVFFAFWLSHVPVERFAEFWDLVRRCLAPNGRIFFVDSRYEQTSTAVDHRLTGADAMRLRRRLNDGREYEIYKIFYEVFELGARLGSMGWRVEISQTKQYFICGQGSWKGA